MPGLETLTPDAARERSRLFFEMRKQMGLEPVHEIRDLTIPGPAGGIPARIFAADIPRPAPALIYFHGGGWVLGNVETYDPLGRALANQAQCVVISVDYRLAPEAKFPAAVEDCYAAAQWIAENAGELRVDRSNRDWRRQRGREPGDRGIADSPGSKRSQAGLSIADLSRHRYAHDRAVD